MSLETRHSHLLLQVWRDSVNPLVSTLFPTDSASLQISLFLRLLHPGSDHPNLFSRGFNRVLHFVQPAFRLVLGAEFYRIPPSGPGLRDVAMTSIFSVIKLLPVTQHV